MCVLETIYANVKYLPPPSILSEVRVLEETLLELAQDAMNNKCVCRICTRLRVLLYNDTQRRIEAQKTTIAMLQGQSHTEIATSELEHIDAIMHAKPLTEE